MLNMFLNFPEIDRNTLFVFGYTDVSVCWVSFLCFSAVAKEGKKF
jgi:hypothetical protein